MAEPWNTQLESALADQPDLLSRIKDSIQIEIDAAKQDGIESASTTSSKSRKRKRELYWTEILHGTGLTFEDEYVDPRSLLEWNDAQLNNFLYRRNAFEYKTFILSRLNEASGGLPSPSKMTWELCRKILHGPISRDDTTIMAGLPEEGVDISTTMGNLDKIFTNASEMDACVRVMFILYETFKGVDGIEISAQPSFGEHPIFTDFLIRLCRNDTLLLLIEVKKPAIYADLHLQNEATAQVIREVQIVLNKASVNTTIPFILTNSLIWSVGMAQKTEDNKVKIISTKNVQPNNTKLLAQILRKFVV